MILSSWCHALIEYPPPPADASPWLVSNQQNMVQVMGCHPLDYVTLCKTSSRVRDTLQTWWHKCPCWRRPCGKELWMASMNWQQSPAESQQKARALSHTISRILTLSTTWMSLGEDSSPVKPLDETTAQRTPWCQPGETLSKYPG